MTEDWWVAHKAEVILGLIILAICILVAVLTPPKR